MKFASSALVLALAFSGTANAADETPSTEAQTKLKIEDTKEKNKVDGDIDQEITNAKLRAESGSKSKWSLTTNFGYNGGSVNQAFGTKRPSLAGRPGDETHTAVSMDPSIRYRWSKNDSLTIGNSFAVNQPFHDKRTTKNRFNFRDPSFKYNRVGKLGSLQTNGAVIATLGTSNESKTLDQAGAFALSYTFLKKLGGGLTLGTSFSAGYNHFTSDPGRYLEKPEKAGARRNYANKYGSYKNFYGGDDRNQFDLGIFPLMEYAFNDTYSFRTVFGYFNWQHYYGDNNKWRFLQTYVYQSVGLGIAVARDIYLYPNVQFVPDNIRSDFTNVALSANINLF